MFCCTGVMLTLRSVSTALVRCSPVMLTLVDAPVVLPVAPGALVAPAAPPVALREVPPLALPGEPDAAGGVCGRVDGAVIAPPEVLGEPAPGATVVPPEVPEVPGAPLVPLPV
ncbi:MAG: hypothetical protein K0S56_1829 [Microvirga sp.]|jgi:hypothetical protein|nr:hypothetical protein [Microvirga sp.]